MKKHVVGFIGCGEIARIHAECLIRHGAAIGGGYDISAQTAERFACSYGGQSYSSAEQLCADPNIDAVYICTRHDTHVDFIDMAARCGKAVFCEKPLAMNVKEAKRAVRIVEETGVPFAIGFNHRYSPGMQRLKQYLDNVDKPFDVLDIRFVTAPFLHGWAGLSELGGGVLVCLGSHVFDLMHYLVAPEIESVNVITLRQRLVDPYLEDTFVATIVTRQKQLISIMAHDHGNMSFSTDPGHRINTTQVFVGNHVVVAGVSDFTVYEPDKVSRVTFPGESATVWGYAEINRRFLELLDGRSVDIPDVYAGLLAAETVERCKKNR